MIPNDLDKQIDNKIIELQRISQSKEKKNKKLNRETVRNILIKEYIDSITNKYNCEWNKSICIYLNIKQITTLTNDDYINFYDGNNIILMPSYLDNEQKPHNFCNYSGMTKSNYKITELLKKKQENRKQKNRK